MATVTSINKKKETLEAQRIAHAKTLTGTKVKITTLQKQKGITATIMEAIWDQENSRYVMTLDIKCCDDRTNLVLDTYPDGKAPDKAMRPPFGNHVRVRALKVA